MRTLPSALAARLPTTTAAGWLRPLDRHTVGSRVALMLILLAVALGVRATGVLHPEPTGPAVPPIPEAALVEPGLLRGAAPLETDLVLLNQTFDVRAVVAVDGATVEEQAVARDLGMRMLTLDVADGEPFSAPELRDVLALLPAPGTDAAGTVYLQDSTGRGSVVALGAMVQILHGRSLPVALDALPTEGVGAPSAAQVQAMRQLAEVVAGTAAPGNPYADLGEVPR